MSDQGEGSNPPPSPSGVSKLRQKFVSPKARASRLLLRGDSGESSSSNLAPVPEDLPSPPAAAAAPKAKTSPKASPRPKGSPRPAPPKHTSTSKIVTGAGAADDVRGHFEYPSARFLVGLQTGMSMGYCAYMLTSWLYCSIQRQVLFPSCSAIWGGAGTWGAWGCIAASLIFWTFPLFCCIVFLLYMYRDLLHTRLYYEMFAHRVHLDFMNIGFFQAMMVQIMLVWMVFCLALYPMTAALSLRGVLVTLPFWIPVLSFGAMLFTQWDLETRLLSVAKFVEGDVEWANQHMLDSFFLRDYVAEAALLNVIKKLEKQKPPPLLTMGDYISLIAEEAERMHDAGEDPSEAAASKTLIASWSSRYWVKLLVYSEYLVDEEAGKFRWWFAFYKAFTVVMICLFLALTFVTVVTHFHHQGLIPSSTLTDWVHLDYLTIVPYDPNASPGTVPGETNAITTITTGGYRYMRDFDPMGYMVPEKPLPHNPEHIEGYVPLAHPAGKKAEQKPWQKEQNSTNGAHNGVTPEHASKAESKPRKEKGRKTKNLVDGLLNRFRPKTSDLQIAQRMQKTAL